jgi:hypothetical protein
MTGATLVIAKLDRLSSNVAFLAQLMDSDHGAPRLTQKSKARRV